MSNQYYNHDDSVPAPQSRGVSTVMRGEFDKVQQGFDQLPSPLQIWADNTNYVASGGVADAWTAALNAAVTSLGDGMQVRVKFGQANATTTPTLNVNALGAKAIVAADGSALAANAIAAGMIVTLTYDAANTCWRAPPGMNGTPAGNAVTLNGAQTITNKTIVNPAGLVDVLTDGAAIDWDASSGQMASLTLSTTQATRVMNNPTHVKDGAPYALLITNNAAGGQTITAWGSAYVLNGATINPGAGATTAFLFLCIGGKLYAINGAGSTGTNIPPSNTVPGAQNTAHDTPRVFSGANGNAITVADPDSNSLSTNVSVNSGTLTATTGSGAAITNNGTASVVITGTPANINAALYGLTFTPTTGFSGVVTLTVATSDGVATVLNTVNITVASASGNRPPVNTVPGAQSVRHDTPFVLSSATNNRISVSDADGGNLTTTISVTSGTTLAVAGGGATITTNGTSSVVIAGTIAQVNAALDGLTFRPATGSSGSVTLTVSTTDGVDTTVSTVALTVAAAPTSQADTIQSPMVRHPVDWLVAGNCVGVDGRWGAASTDPSVEPSLTEGPASYQFQQFMERSLVVQSDGSVAFAWDLRWPTVNANGHNIQGNSYYSEVKTYPSILFGKKPGFYGSGMWPAFSVVLRNADGRVEPVPNPSYTPSNIASDWQPAGGSAVQTSPSGSTPGTGASVMPMQLPLSGKTCRIRGKLLHRAPPTGMGHISFDIWLTQTGPQIQGHVQSSMTHEIMIPLCLWGHYGQYGYRNPAWYDHDVTIDGVLYHVYCTKRLNRNPVTGAYDNNGTLGYYPGLQYTFGGLDTVNHYTNEETGSDRVGWKLIVFEPDGVANAYSGVDHPVDGNGYFNIDFTKFLAHLALSQDERNIAFIRNVEYLQSIEVGAEIVAGTANYTIYNYLVQASNTVDAAPALPTYTNHAPVNTVPATQGATNGTPFVFSAGNGNAVTVLDIDNDALTTTLTLTAGTMTVPTLPGAVVTGNGTGTVTLHGSTSQINSVLDGMTFNAAGTGTVTLTVQTTDGSLTDTDTVTINVTGPSNAPSLIQTQFTAGNGGTWLHNAGLSEFYTDGTGTTVPTSWTDLIGRWINHGNTGNGHDLLQTDATLRFQLGTDAGGKHYAQGFNGAPMKNVGASTTAFYACLALNMTATYDGVILSDRLTANTGITLEQEAFAAVFYAKFGTGSALVTCTSPAYGASNTSAPTCVLEAWYDGTNCATRMNKGTPDSHALASLSAGNADMLLCGNYPLSGGVSSNNSTCNIYEAVVFKNYCPNSSDRDTIASWVGAQAGLTI